MKKELRNMDDLLKRYMTGDLSDDEYRKITDFIKANKNNARYFNEFKESWKPGKNSYTDRSWKKLSNKIHRSTQLNHSFTRKRSLFINLRRIAAVLIIGVLVVVIYFVITIDKPRSSKVLVFEAPHGEKSKVVLQDSTLIWLNSSSKILVKNSYNVLNRKVILEGEAYFEVAENKRLPFRVSTKDLYISVLGTKFNVIAYPNEIITETSVIDGVVEVSTKEKSETEKIILKKNQKATYNKNDNTLTSRSANTEIDIAWMDNMLIFDNEHYLRVFNKLERWYGVDIEVEGEINYEPHYTFKIKTESLGEMLDLINIIAPIEYKIDGNKVVIKFLGK